MAKTKAEITEELEQLILLEEQHNIRVMDALENAIDYIRSSTDRMAEIVAFEADPETQRLIAESEKEKL
jgi:hypothetical protein